MPRIETTVDCPVYDSFRVRQVAGMLDVPLGQRAAETFSVDLPSLDEEWQIGAIVGPSGSGKSTIARAAFGALTTGSKWPANKALIDGFSEQIPIKEVTGMLTAVGFSQPPAWLKPYGVLSGGQKFRADLARALLQGQLQNKPVVFDEFTSVVDRTVAQIGSAAVAKTIRRIPELRFVAVACHYDILDWLQPDWILDMATQQLARGSLRQRPDIELQIHRAGPASWELFKHHHYLSHTVPRGARYYLASLPSGDPVGLIVVGTHFGRAKLLPGCSLRRTISRIVILPDYQGIGIAGKFLDTVAELLTKEQVEVRITTGHPGMIKLLARAERWRVVNFLGNGSDPRNDNRPKAKQRKTQIAFGRCVATALFLGSPAASPKAPRRKK